MCRSPGASTADDDATAPGGGPPAGGTTGASLSTAGRAADCPASPGSKGATVQERPSAHAAEPTGPCEARSPPPPPEDLVAGLRRTPKYLPCRFLYDARGSQLYEQITRLKEYYPYEAELALLRQHAADIAGQVPAGGVVLELGCGDCSKTAVLLHALVERHGARGVRFCGVDVSAEALRQTERSLARALPQLPAGQVELVEAEYLEGVRAVRARHPDALLTVLWLGSSVGNFSASEAAGFLRALRCAAGEACQLLLATDLWKDAGALRAAYDDSQGISRDFILNGAHHALATLGHPAAHQPGVFAYECVVNAEEQQVEMWVRARRALPGVLPGVGIEEGERVLVEVSRKFTPEAVADMSLEAGLYLGAAWGSRAYALHLLLPPALALRRCWADTDALFGCVLDWQARPIALRHPFLFYAGHCAAFSKLKLLPDDPPTQLDTLFSRGIDPSVADPSRCHAHPPVPERWPSQRDVEGYVAGVRRRLLAAVDDPGSGLQPSQAGAQAGGGGGCASNGAGAGRSLGAGRRLAVVLEHERMHQETLCYMLAQQRKADFAAAARGEPPALAAPPSSGSLGAARGALPFYLPAGAYAATSLPCRSPPTPLGSPKASLERTQQVPQQQGASSLQPRTPGAPLAGGLPARVAAPRPGTTAEAAPAADCAEFISVPSGEVTLGLPPAAPHGHRWDCELGSSGPQAVPAFSLAAAPVSVAQFRDFVFERRGYERGELWEPGALEHLRAAGRGMPAGWSLQAAGGGAPQLWVHQPEGSYRAEEVGGCPVYVSLAEARAYCRLHGARLMSEAEWARAAGSQAAAEGTLCQLDSGGWEWTDTQFAPLPGWAPDPLYPEFSADFFTPEHRVLHGASPWTHPSLARHSFRNWYQALYPYAAAKFRLARDGGR